MYDKTSILEMLERSPPGHTLPQAFYNHPGVYDFDVREVFTRAWLMIGFEEELPDAGSYLSLMIGQSPILVLRARDRSIRGFHNTCRHRGSQLYADGCGRTPKLVCPYHKWTYELDGRLIGAPRMHEGFEAAEHSLKPLRVELLSGCIYIALSDDVPDFAPFRAATSPLLAPYKLADAKLAYQSTLFEAADWKLVMENAREC